MIRKPEQKDFQQIEELFRLAIGAAYAANGIDAKDDEQQVINKQLRQVEEFLAGDSESFYLVAVVEEKVVGIIAYAEPTEIYEENFGDVEGVPLIKSVYIHPDYQRQGIGTELFKRIIAEIKQLGAEYFFLDTGYRNAQDYWKQKVGEPSVILENYYPNEDDLWLWKVKVEQLKNN